MQAPTQRTREGAARTRESTHPARRERSRREVRLRRLRRRMSPSSDAFPSASSARARAAAHTPTRESTPRVNAAARVDANARARARRTRRTPLATRTTPENDQTTFRPSPGRAPLADVVVPPEEAAERAWFASTSASLSVPASPSASTRLGGSGGRLGGGGAVVPPSPPRGSGLVAEDDERPGTRTDALRDGLRRSGDSRTRTPPRGAGRTEAGCLSRTEARSTPGCPRTEARLTPG